MKRLLAAIAVTLVGALVGCGRSSREAHEGPEGGPRLDAAERPEAAVQLDGASDAADDAPVELDALAPVDLPRGSTAARFSLRISVAVDDAGKPVADGTWLAGEIDAAQRLFGPLGIRFVREEGAPLDAHLAHMEMRADRDALASHVTPHVIDVFVVASLRDVDDPAQMRRGVHWHAPSGVHYVILVASAPTTVLAHELGHYFGNPHSHVPDNVMSYDRTGAPVFFDAEQGKRIAARARLYVKSGELLEGVP